MRPIADAALVSPADGTMLHFGAVQGARVEQVKGITYSLDALLGVERRKPINKTTTVPFLVREMAIVDDREFAKRERDRIHPLAAHRHLRAYDSRLSTLWGRRGGNDAPGVPGGPASVWAPVPATRPAQVRSAD
jgi:phosphatidylserine decarboxylase